MSVYNGSVVSSEAAVFRPNPTRQTFLLRVWRSTTADAWRYTIVIPNVEKRQHFHSLANAMQFIDSLLQ